MGKIVGVDLGVNSGTKGPKGLYKCGSSGDFMEIRTSDIYGIAPKWIDTSAINSLKTKTFLELFGSGGVSTTEVLDEREFTNATSEGHLGGKKRTVYDDRIDVYPDYPELRGSKVENDVRFIFSVAQYGEGIVITSDFLVATGTINENLDLFFLYPEDWYQLRRKERIAKFIKKTKDRLKYYEEKRNILTK